MKALPDVEPLNCIVLLGIMLYGIQPKRGIEYVPTWMNEPEAMQIRMAYAALLVANVTGPGIY